MASMGPGRRASKIHTLLVVGITGAGKSTLCNTLAQIDPEDESAFKEGDACCSETGEYQAKEIEGKWKVVDTVGLGDTSTSVDVVYRDIAEACNECAVTGISQILLITRGRVTEEQLAAFKVIGSVLLDEKMWNYTTLIKTGFARFTMPDRCAADIKNMKEKHPALAELLPLINDRVVHVDMQDSAANVLWREKRQESREKVFNHLSRVIRPLPYLPPNLKRTQERIKEELQRLREKEDMQAKMEQQAAQIKKLEEEGKASAEQCRRLRQLETEIQTIRAEKNQAQRDLVSKMQSDDPEKGVFVHIGRGLDNAGAKVVSGAKAVGTAVKNNCCIQ